MSRQLVLEGERHLRLRETEPRALEPGEVRVAVAAAGICGSDVHGFSGRNDRRAPGTVMGHEVSGRIVETGPGVHDLRVGDHVAVNPIVACGTCEPCAAGYDNLCVVRRLYGCVPELPGAFADEMVVRAANAVVLPVDVPIELGALAEPLAVGWHATGIGAELAGLDQTLVIGGGPIGLGAALAAAARGHAPPVVVEPVAARREVARRLGLQAVAPDALDIGRAGFDVVLDCAGFPSTFALALSLVRPRGTVVFVGLAQHEIPMNAELVEVGERRISGSAAYTRADFRHAAALIAGGHVDVAPMIELEVGFDGLIRAFDDYADGRSTAIKAVLRPSR